MNNMIYCECTIVDLENRKTAGKYFKTFDNISDFNAFYKIAKDDMSMILNIILNYSPMDKPMLKSVYDAKLLNLSRSSSV